MRISILLTLPLILLLLQAASADMYRCKLPDGSVVFGDKPVYISEDYCQKVTESEPATLEKPPQVTTPAVQQKKGYYKKPQRKNSRLIKEKIKPKPERQVLAGICGVVLLVAGIALYFIPSPEGSEEGTTPTAAQPVAAAGTPEPGEPTEAPSAGDGEPTAPIAGGGAAENTPEEPDPSEPAAEEEMAADAPVVEDTATLTPEPMAEPK